VDTWPNWHSWDLSIRRSGFTSRALRISDLWSLIVAKCHTENSSQISQLGRLFFWQYYFSRHLRFMTTCEDRNKDRFKNWKLCVLWKLPFRHHAATKLTQNCVCFTSSASIPLFWHSSIVNTTPMYLNASTYCSVFPLTCRIHCLGRLKKQLSPSF